MFDLLSQEQIIVIATALIVQAVKIIWIKLLKQEKPSAGYMRLFVFVVAVVLALVSGGFDLPIFSEDPMQFAIALIASAGEVLMFAHVLYEAILKGVLEWLDRGKEILAP